MLGLKVRFVCVWNCLICFHGWILIRLTWNLSRFVPNSVEILTWNFRKKLFQENFSEILCKPWVSFTKTCEILPYFLQFCFVSVLRWNNSHKYFHMLFWNQVRRHVHKKNHKKKIRRRKVGSFCFRKSSFFHPRSWTYYALLLQYFGWKFLPHVCHCVYSVLVDIWAPDSSQEIGTKFFIDHCHGWKEASFVCETVWFFRGWILIRFTLNLLRFVPYSVEILTWNFRKKLFRENFSEILCKPRLSSTKTC